MLMLPIGLADLIPLCAHGGSAPPVAGAASARLLEFLGVSGGASECAALPLTLKSTAMGPSNQRDVGSVVVGEDVVQSLDELAATVRRHSG
jgi:hypothetical protein